MMYSFSNAGFNPGLMIPYFQSFFGLFTLVGFVLLAYWAMHNLSKNHQRTVAITILGVGMVGLLLTAWMQESPRSRLSNNDARFQMMNGNFKNVEEMRKWAGCPALNQQVQSSSSVSSVAAPAPKAKTK